MTRGLYSAASGMPATISAPEVMTNNLANVNTPGFKRDIPVYESFSNILGKKINQDTHQIRMQNTVVDPRQRKLTDNVFNFTLEGEGFFVLSTSQGLAYTRDDRFYLDTKGRLVNSDGYTLLGVIPGRQTADVDLGNDEGPTASTLSQASTGNVRLMFCVGPDADFNRVRQANVNIIQKYGGADESYLNKAQEYGLGVLYSIKYLVHDPMRGKSSSECWDTWEQIKPQVQAVVTTYKDHPALFGWYVLDEPNLYGCGIPKDLQQEIYNSIKSWDPNHPVTMAIAGGPGDLGYDSVNWNAVDIIIPDVYCYGASGLVDLNWAASNLRHYFDEHGINVPVIFTIQACSEPGGSWQGRIRDQIDVVVRYGLATGGIGMWAWGDGVEGPGDSDRTFGEVSAANMGIIYS